MTKNLEYWVKFSFDKMRKDRTIMQTIIPQIIEMEEFKNSDISEEELRQGIKERFIHEREKLKDKLRDMINENKNDKS